MAEHLAGRILHRHAQVTVGADLLQPEILREQRLQMGPCGAHISGRHALAGRAGEAVTESLTEPGSLLIRERARFHRVEGLGDEGVAGMQRLCGVSGQRAERLFARGSSRAFGEHAQDFERRIAFDGLLHGLSGPQSKNLGACRT